MNRVFPISHPEASPADAHIFPAQEGVKMIHAHIQGDRKGWRSMAFHADAIKQLLAQEGAAGIRCHMAMHDGESTLVITAVNSAGSDLVAVNNIAIQNGESCPPFCW